MSTPGGYLGTEVYVQMHLFIEFEKCCQVSTFSLLYSLDATVLVNIIEAHCLLSWKMRLQSEHTWLSRRQFITMGSVIG